MRTLALSMARICVLLMPLLCGCVRITEFAMTGQDAANPHDAPSTERQDLDRQRMTGARPRLTSRTRWVRGERAHCPSRCRGQA